MKRPASRQPSRDVRERSRRKTGKTVGKMSKEWWKAYRTTRKAAGRRTGGKMSKEWWKNYNQKRSKARKPSNPALCPAPPSSIPALPSSRAPEIQPPNSQAKPSTSGSRQAKRKAPPATPAAEASQDPPSTPHVLAREYNRLVGQNAKRCKLRVWQRQYHPDKAFFSLRDRLLAAESWRWVQSMWERDFK
jgi:hypothetical protein